MKGVRRVFHWSPLTIAPGRAIPSEIYQSNVEGTKRLFEVARQSGAERIVYTSTVATLVVPTADGSLPNEGTPGTLDQTSRGTAFWRIRLMAEVEAMKAAADGVPVVIVNPTTPVGAGDWKPTPTGRIIVDFMKGKMPAYVDTGLNRTPSKTLPLVICSQLKREESASGYLLAGAIMTLKEILERARPIAGRPAPRFHCRTRWRCRQYLRG